MKFCTILKQHWKCCAEQVVRFPSYNKNYLRKHCNLIDTQYIINYDYYIIRLNIKALIPQNCYLQCLMLISS